SGGLCRKLEAGYSPTFPNARYVLQQGEWGIAVNPQRFHKASYAPESLKPIEQRGQLALVNGDAEVVPGIRYDFTAGHTENHAVIWFEDSGEAGVFFGDLVPTLSHVPTSWISAYDINAGGSYGAREVLYPNVVKHNARCFFYHEPEYPVGTIVQDKNKYRAKPLLQH